MWSLHGLYKSRLGVQPGYRVVTNGPYRLVHHPSYFGGDLVLFGIGCKAACGSMIGGFEIRTRSWMSRLTRKP